MSLEEAAEGGSLAWGMGMGAQLVWEMRCGLPAAETSMSWGNRGPRIQDRKGSFLNLLLCSCSSMVIGRVAELSPAINLTFELSPTSSLLYRMI
jgi:hypothetical protein